MADIQRQALMARLLMQHRIGLYAFIFSCVRNHTDAEDILQNVCVAVMESFEQLTDEAGFYPWVREIARRRVLAFRREQQRETSLDPDLVQALSEAAEWLEKQDTTPKHHLALFSCLESLPADSRKLITLRYQSGNADAAEMAKQFGYTTQSIYARIKRIKLLLRECVEKRLQME